MSVITIRRSKVRIKKTGEIFTPIPLVQEILDRLPESVWNDPLKTFLDNSCGVGNFLLCVTGRKLEHGHTTEQALSTTFGVELMPDNVEECQNRLLGLAALHDEITLAEAQAKYGVIVQRNIVCADALTHDYSFDGVSKMKPERDGGECDE
jgi:hypothetical protein